MAHAGHPEATGSSFGPASQCQQALDEPQRQDGLLLDPALEQLEGQVEAVRLNLEEADQLVDQLIQQPRVGAGRPGKLAGNAQPSGRQFEKPRGASSLSGTGVVVDVASQLPAEHVEAEIVEVPESVVRRIQRFADAASGLNGIGSQAAQLQLEAERDKSRLEVGANPMQMGLRHARIEDTARSAHGVFDIVDQIQVLRRHHVQAPFDDQVHHAAVGVDHPQGRHQTDRPGEKPLAGPHVLQVETVSALDLLVELVEQHLSQHQRQVIAQVWLRLRIVQQMADARSWPVQFAFQPVIADGIRVVVAHDQIAFGRGQQLAFGQALQFGVDGPLAGTRVSLEEPVDALAKPQFVDEIDVKPVAEACAHRFGRHEIGLGLDRPMRGVDMDRLPLVAFSFISVDLRHRREGHVMNHESFDPGVRRLDGVVIHVVRADPPMARQKGRLGKQRLDVDLRGLAREGEAADRLEDATVSKRSVDEEVDFSLVHRRLDLPRRPTAASGHGSRTMRRRSCQSSRKALRITRRLAPVCRPAVRG